MNTIENLLFELYDQQFPKGISWDDINLHPEVDAYFSFILRYAVRYMNGEKVNPDDIKINEKLSERLDRSIEILTELQNYWNRHNELVNALIEAIENEKNT